jgi:nitric oxide reductase subunit B
MQVDLVAYLMNPRNWWGPLLLIFIISFTGVFIIGRQTYTDAPPVASFINENGEIVFSKQQIQQGQDVFHRYAFMEYGSMFGDGAYRSTDFTAEALHLTAQYMREYYVKKNRETEDAVIIKVQKEIKNNRYEKLKEAVILSPAQVYAADRIIAYWFAKKNELIGADPVHPFQMLKSEEELKSLAAFFYWGAWVCGAERPGKKYSYTHNWPFDPQAGNYPSAAVILWSIIGSLGLILGLGWVLYYHGRMEKLDDEAYINRAQGFMSRLQVSRFSPVASQRATYKYFYVAIALFLIQVLAGVLTIHDFVRFVNYFGWNISVDLPVQITRSWHVQLSVLWISACWIGASLFVAPFISPNEPPGQVKWINTLFWMIFLLVGGSFVGIFLGPSGILGENWRWWGSQGWEYMEMGRIWQWWLMGIFLVWFFTLFRALKPALKKNKPWAMPNWLLYATGCVIGLLVSGFIANPKTNFVIADFWRWCVIHMWAEAFFEVFTTVLVGYFMVLMGLVSRQAATRVIYIATLLFLGSGLLGISHNFYWNAKPIATMALGAVFSTLQVVPLVLLTLEAWRFRKLPQLLEQRNQANGNNLKLFGMPEVFLFLLGVNFWNFLGAGVFGFIINLPVANYYEHGTYLTVNHGHAALMGVYGNLSLATVLFCSQLMIKSSAWNARLIRQIFWSINIGLFLMVLLDLFPSGILQFNAVLEHGLWYARSSLFLDGMPFQTLTWLRIIGGSVFLLGGVIPLLWFLITRIGRLKKTEEAISYAETLIYTSESTYGEKVF